MTFQKGRLIILLLFLISLVIAILFSFIARMNDRIGEPFLEQLLLTFLKVYSTNLSVIFATAFFKENTDGPIIKRSAFIIAIILCLIWNLLLLVQTGVFVFSNSDDNYVEDLIPYLQNISLNSSFLIAGSLAYFFSTETKS